MHPRAAAGLIAAGLTAVVVAGFIAVNVHPIESDEMCSQFGRCAGPDADTTLTRLGWVQAAGITAVLVGLVVRVRALPPDPPETRPAGWAAVAAGVVGAVVAGVLGTLVLVALSFGPHAIAAAVLFVGALEAACVTSLLTLGRPPTRTARIAGPLAAAVAIIATVAVVVVSVLSRKPIFEALWLLVPAHGVALAAAVLIIGPAVTPRRVTGLLAVVAMGVAAGFLPQVFPKDVPPPPTAAGPPATAFPVPTPSPPEPVPPTLAPVPVRTDTPCDPAALVWSAGSWDAAMGLRYASVVARHDGPQPCFVERVTTLRIVQGGRPLQLTTVVGDLSDPADGTAPARVGIAPGGAARFALTWRGYGAAADDTTPQQLSVGTPPIAVPLAPKGFFDLVDGGTIYIGGWHPA